MGSTLEAKWTYSYGPQLVGGINHPCTHVQKRSNTVVCALSRFEPGKMVRLWV